MYIYTDCLFIYLFFHLFIYFYTYVHTHLYIYMPQNLQDSSHRTAIWSEMHVKFWSPETQNTKQDLV